MENMRDSLDSVHLDTPRGSRIKKRGTSAEFGSTFKRETSTQYGSTQYRSTFKRQKMEDHKIAVLDSVHLDIPCGSCGLRIKKGGTSAQFGSTFKRETSTQFGSTFKRQTPTQFGLTFKRETPTQFGSTFKRETPTQFGSTFKRQKIEDHKIAVLDSVHLDIPCGSCGLRIKKGGTSTQFGSTFKRETPTQFGSTFKRETSTQFGSTFQRETPTQFGSTFKRPKKEDHKLAVLGNISDSEVLDSVHLDIPCGSRIKKRGTSTRFESTSMRQKIEDIKMTFSRTSRVKTERKVCLKNGTDYQAVYEEETRTMSGYQIETRSKKRCAVLTTDYQIETRSKKRCAVLTTDYQSG